MYLPTELYNNHVIKYKKEEGSSEVHTFIQYSKRIVIQPTYP